MSEQALLLYKSVEWKSDYYTYCRNWICSMLSRPVLRLPICVFQA